MATNVSLPFRDIGPFVMIVLMTTWLNFTSMDMEQPQYQCLEFFNGVGRIGRLAHNRGYSACCYDVLYDPVVKEAHDKNPKKPLKGGYMDLSSDGGFTFLGPKHFK